jgi:hypothetical protein
MNENLAKIIVAAETISAQSDKDIILYDRFNSLISKLFKTLTGTEYRPEYVSMYPKAAQAFLDSARELFYTNEFLTDVTGASDLLQLIDYSERSLALIGDTKSIKDKFKINDRFIGRFNKNLTVKGQSVAGWVFPKKYHDLLTKIVADHNTFNSPFCMNSKGENNLIDDSANSLEQRNLFPQS